MTNTKIISWSKWDTPIPKKGEIISNMFNEKFKVLSVLKANKYSYTIELEVLP